MKFIRKFKRVISIQLIFAMVLTMKVDLSFGITGHSSMPEYRSFEPASTTNMVNLFSGDFTYNIPLLDVPNGYPINLSYHSNDVNNEAQSSWVGLGWTLNPGAVNRMKRGFPDEFDGQKVTYYNRSPKNWTISANVSVSGETKGAQFKGALGKTIAYNNYQGFAESFYGSVTDPLGISSLTLSYSEGKFGFDPSFNMSKGLSYLKSKIKSNDPKDGAPDGQTEKKEKKEKKTKLSFLKKGKLISGSHGDRFNWSVSKAKPKPTPLSVSEYTGLGFNIQFDAGANSIPFPLEVGEVSAGGSYSYKKNKDKKTLKTYGYMNSENALDDETAMMDYFTENEIIYDKYEKNLGVPFPNNDVFSLTGESMGGTFRAFRSDFGHYRKNKTKNSMKTATASGDASFGTQLQSAGGELGGAFQTSSVGAWENKAYKKNKFKAEADFKNTTNERFVLRFTGDRAGSFDQVNGNTSPIRLFDDKYQETVNEYLKDKRVPRSTYVNMKKNEDFGYESSNHQVPYKVNQQYLSIVNESNNVIDYVRQEDKAMGEVSTYNKNGTRFTYGLPLYTKNEKQLSYHLKNVSFLPKSEGMVAEVTENNLDRDSDTKMGFESPEKYASQFLLTQITNTDYIDRTFDGPTPDDFGSYTRFNYKRFAGGDGNWYQYRSPFKGLNYSVGSLSTKRDNTGSYSSGDKELYYVHSVASKTHVAFFYTSDRKDGFEANLDVTKGGGDNKGESLQKLDRIELYALSDCKEISTGKGIYEPKSSTVFPIKTVRFEYSYELCTELPNNNGEAYQDFKGNDVQNEGGKLTLKKVWFEYEGRKTSKISPYQFSYQYPKFVSNPSQPNHLKTPIAPYGDLVNDPVQLKHFGDINSDEQNPYYVTANSDRWGNYRDYGGLKDNIKDLAHFFPFVNQNPDPDGGAVDFDPAAYCLKQITLPSGGNILIQYEQDDYAYVQDQKVMAMFPLSSTTTSDEGNKKKKYYVDLNKVGVSLPENRATKRIKIRQLFEPMIKKKRMYFNFLYRLEGAGRPNHKSTNSEYVEGFAFIKGYGYDASNSKVYFVFNDDDIEDEDNEGENIFVPVNSDGATEEVPREVCREFYKASRTGIVSNSDNNGLSNSKDKNKESDVLKYLVKRGVSHGNQCKTINPTMSYVRLQLPSDKAKLGGGVRVKRLLMHDEGIGSNGVATLYGNEYEYKQKIKSSFSSSGFIEVSSGVATNEPSAGRKESPLVYPIPRKREDRFSNGILNAVTKKLGILAGKNLYKNLGPIGETFYPGASVGYGKVTVKNIHQGQTSSGNTVHEFFTCKDFPVEKVKKTEIKPKGNKALPKGLKGNANFGAVGGSVGVTKLEMAQGYTFINNNMHGQPKKVQQFAVNSSTPLAETIYEYYRYKEKVKVMGDHMIEESTPLHLGVDSEVLAESREVVDQTISGFIGADKSFGYFPAAPAIPVYYDTKVKVNGGVSFNKSTMRTHVTNKLITYPAILKKVVTISPDRVKHTTENLVFDKYTGDPVRTRTYDDFDQPFINQQIMASWEYPSMKSKALNENVKATGKFLWVGSTGYLDFNYPEMDDCDVMGKFIEGDFISISKEGEEPVLVHVASVDTENLRVQLLKSGLQKNGFSSYLLSGDIIDIEVIKSGYQNNMAASIGGLTYKDSKINPILREGEYTDKGNDFITALNDAFDSYFTDPSTSGVLEVASNNNTNFSGVYLSFGSETFQATCDDNLKKVDLNLNIENDFFDFEIASILLPNNEVINCETSPSLSNIRKSYSPKVCDETPDIELSGTYWSRPLDCGEVDDQWLLMRYDCASPKSFPSNGILKLGPNTTDPICIRLDYEENTGFEDDRNRFYYDHSSTAGDLIIDWRDRVHYDRPRETFSKLPTSGWHYFGQNLGFDGCGGGFFGDNDATAVVNAMVCVESYRPNFSLNASGNVSYTGDPVRISFSLSNNELDGNSGFIYSYDLYKKGSTTLIENKRGSGKQYFDINEPGEYEIVAKVSKRINGGYQVIKAEFSIDNNLNSCDCNNHLPAKDLNQKLSNGSFTDQVGQFYYSKKSGKVFFKAKDCPLYRPVNCMKVCEPTPPTRTALPVVDVVSASASTLSDRWSNTFSDYPIKDNTFNWSSFNDYETGERGKWRTKSSFVYRDQINPNEESRNFEKGLFSLSLFDWQEPNKNSSKWVLTTTVNTYDPNGQPIEDQNILGIKSSAIYGYNHTLPTMVAQNARRENILFESFEESDQEDIVLNNAHSGNKSLLLSSNSTNYLGEVRTRAEGESYQIKFWLKTKLPLETILKELTLFSENGLRVKSNYDLKKVASSGEWMLLEAKFSDSQSRFNQHRDKKIYLKMSDQITSKVFIDDFRLQPSDSEAVCYVYDHAQRLTAVLDDQHFASIYQYNSEGVLVRKLKETNEGIKTISETQYNTKGISRDKL